MTTPGTNFVASKDTVLKEGYFKKRNFKGELGHAYSRRWCVLTSRYFEWFDHPNGKRKQTIPLDHAYCRIHEGTGLIVGSYQTNKEWLLRDEGASPAATAAEWLDAIQKAIENYRNVSGSAAASGSESKGLVPLSEIVAKQHSQTTTQTAMAPSPVGGGMMSTTMGGPALSPAPAAYHPHTPAGGSTTTTMTTTYSGGGMMAPAPMMAPSPQVVTTNYAMGGGYAAPTTTTYTTGYQPAYVAPPAPTYVQTIQPPMMTYAQPAFVQPQMTIVTAPPPMVIQQPPTMTFYNPMY